MDDFFREYLKQRELKLFAELIESLQRQKGIRPSYNMAQTTGKTANKLEHKIAVRYSKELRMIRREVGETGDSSEDENYPSGLPPKVMKIDKKVLEKSYHQYLKAKRQEPPKKPDLVAFTLKSLLVNNHKPEIRAKTEPPKSLLKNPVRVNDMEVVEEAVANIPGMDFAEDQGQKHASFFALLRDKFRAYPGYMTKIPELREDVRMWEESGSAPWVSRVDNWASNVPSAVAFLLGAFPEDCKPADFIALVKCNPLIGTYTWIGSGRDSDADLSVLTELWLSIKHLVKDFKLPGQHEVLRVRNPSPVRVPSPEPPKEIPVRDFHTQEKERMSNPTKPYTYRLSGHEKPISVGKLF